MAKRSARRRGDRGASSASDRIRHQYAGWLASTPQATMTARKVRLIVHWDYETRLLPGDLLAPVIGAHPDAVESHLLACGYSPRRAYRRARQPRSQHDAGWRNTISGNNAGEKTERAETIKR